ncbi:MAG: biotin synthase BioB [Verrucomicrobium sp.]|nr:biotin synthase BioB [Verrucomicrobium sp.]
MATLSELQALYALPLFELITRSRAVYAAHWPEQEVQLCSLLSIKTGGCSEDCSYCAQSAHYSTGVESEKLLSREKVMEAARDARARGASRFCMGAAWKGLKENDPKLDAVCEIVDDVSKLGMEVCVTLGHLDAGAARRLKEAGVTAYNHNLDTSPDYYPEIVTTHTYADRLETISAAQQAGMSVCCGGIVGLGESADDRLKMLEVLSGFNPPPESVPINCLTPIAGTPLAEQDPVDIFEIVRLIAVTRITFPQAKVRLSAGRTRLTREGQALCFYAGANSIFFGSKLLTAPNPEADQDLKLLKELGFRMPSQLAPASAC